jgi:hypothetical protein
LEEAWELREVRRESRGIYGADEDERLGDGASRAVPPGAWAAMPWKLFIDGHWLYGRPEGQRKGKLGHASGDKVVEAWS